MSNEEVEEEETEESTEEEVNDHDDQVVEDGKTGETLHIPGDKATTELKDTEGNVIPDRVLTILHNEYVNYPEYIGDYKRVGEIHVNQDLNNKLPNDPDVVDPMVKNYVLETVTYEDKNGNTQKIKKTIEKKYYPTIQKIREMAAAAVAPPQ